MGALQLATDSGSLEITGFSTESGLRFISVPLKFQAYGKALYTAPVVVLASRRMGVNSDSTVLEKMSNVIGQDKFIDINSYSILEFGLQTTPDSSSDYEAYLNFSSADLDQLLKRALKKLKLPEAFATIKVD